MFQFLESPPIIWLIITFFFLFFFVLFFTMSPRTNGKHQISPGTSMKMVKKNGSEDTGTSIEVVKENGSECTMFGFLEKLPKGEPIPDECLSCRKLVGCLMKKRAFEWYTGQEFGSKKGEG